MYLEQLWKEQCLILATNACYEVTAKHYQVIQTIIKCKKCERVKITIYNTHVASTTRIKIRISVMVRVTVRLRSILWLEFELGLH